MPLSTWNYTIPWGPNYQLCHLLWLEEDKIHEQVFSSVTQSCPALCDPMNHSTPGLPVYHQLPKSTQTQAHRVGDTIQPSHPLLSPSPPAPNPSQHQGLFQWVNSSHEVAKVLEFQLQHQSSQWTSLTSPQNHQAERLYLYFLPSFQEDFLLSLWPPPCRCDNNYIAGSKESISLTLPSGHFPAFSGNSLCGSMENIPQAIKTRLWLSRSACTLCFCFHPFLVPLVSRGQSCKEFILKSRLGFKNSGS